MIPLIVAMMAALFITAVALSTFGSAFLEALDQPDIYEEYQPKSAKN